MPKILKGGNFMATISNQASVSYTFSGSVETQNALSNVSNTTLIESFSLEVNKESYQSNFTNGENITYTVKITNTGLNTISNFTLVDNLGEIDGGIVPLIYQAESARIYSESIAITPITPTSVNPLTFTFDNELPVGDSLVLSYVATVSGSLPSTVTSITNSATVTSINNNPVTRIDETITGDDSHTITRENNAELVVTKGVSTESVTSGDTYSYTITISNLGSLPATAVVVTDTLPQGFTVLSIDFKQNGETSTLDPSEYSIDAETNTLTLPAGSTLEIDGYQEGVDNSVVITINGAYSE